MDFRVNWFSFVYFQSTSSNKPGEGPQTGRQKTEGCDAAVMKVSKALAAFKDEADA